MLRKFKVIIIVSVLLLIGIIGAFAALYTYTNVVDKSIAQLLNRMMDDNVRIEYAGLSGNLLGTVRIEDLNVYLSGNTISCKRVDLNYSLIDFVKRKYIIEQLLIFEPNIFLHGSKSDTTVATPDIKDIPVDSLMAQFNLEGFPYLQLGRLIVKDGQVIFKGQNQTEAIKDVQLQLAAEITTEKIAIQPKYIRGNWENRDIEIKDLSFSLTGSKKRITLNQLELKVPDLKLVGHGELEFDPGFRFLVFADSSRIDLNLLRKLVPEFPYREGFTKFYGSFIGTPLDFKGELFLAGKFDSLRVHHLKTNYQRQQDRFDFEDISFRSNFGALNGVASISSRHGNQIALQFREVDLMPPGFVTQPTDLNGDIDFRFDDWDLQNFDGDGEILLHSLNYGMAHIDSINLKLTANRGNWQILDPSRIVVAKNSVFNLAGKVNSEQVLDINVSTQNNNLDSLLSHFSIPEAGGTGNLDMHFTGNLTDPSVAGQVRIDSLYYQKSVIYGIYGDFNLTDLVEKRRGNFDLEIATGFVGDIFLTSGQIKSRLHENRVFLDPFQFYSEENSFTIRGVIFADENAIEVLLARLAIEYQNYSIVNDKPVRTRFYADTLNIDMFSLRAAESGFISAKGFLAFEGESSLSLKLNNIRLEPFNQYLYWHHSLKGYIDTQMDFTGKIDNPEVILGLSLNDLVFDGRAIGKVESEFYYRNQGLGVNFFNFERGENSYLTVNGGINLLFDEENGERQISGSTPLNMNVVLGNMMFEDFNDFFDFNYPVEGSISGRLDLAGTLGEPKGSLNLTGNDIRFADHIFPEFVIDTRIQPDRIILDLASINYLNTQILVNGFKTINWDFQSPEATFRDKNFRLRVKIEDDSLNFLGALNPELDRLIGDIKINALLEGEYDDPEITESDIRIRGGRLFLSKLENSINEIDMDAHFEQPYLVIDKLTARSPKQYYQENFLEKWVRKIRNLLFADKRTGNIRGRGRIDFTHLDRPKYDLQVSLDNVYANYFLENTQVVVSSNNVHVSGRDTILIEGDLLVNEGDIVVDFEESEKNVLLSPSLREEPPFVEYNFDIEILPNFYVRSSEPLNSFDLQLSGNLRVIQEARSLLEMNGTLETSGDYFIQGEDFEIQSGRIDFVNPKELPEVNLFAQKRKNNFVFNLNVRGRIDQPEKEITVQDEMGNTVYLPDVKDKMALLLFGVRFDELGTSTDSLLLQKGEQVLTQAVISTIESEARTFTGLDQIRLDAQESFFKSRLNKPSTLALGKYLTSKLYLEYKSRLASSGVGNIPSPSLSWEAGNEVYLQYRLNRNWSFSTIFQKTLEGNDKVKLDISWQVSF